MDTVARVMLPSVIVLCCMCVQSCVFAEVRCRSGPGILHGIKIEPLPGSYLCYIYYYFNVETSTGDLILCNNNHNIPSCRDACKFMFHTLHAYCILLVALHVICILACTCFSLGIASL